MYYVSTQGIDERMINVHYYCYVLHVLDKQILSSDVSNHYQLKPF